LKEHLDLTIIKELLLELSKSIVNNLENPLILSDFLTKCLNEGSLELQVLSLRSIFILIEKHGFDYPDYYKKLYGMI